METTRKNNTTELWKYYELGRQYNNQLVPNQYNLVNTNIEFFAGNQWLHIAESPAMQRLARPTFNIIKRITSLFVASLTSSNTTINFEPLSYYDGDNMKDPENNAAVIATAEVRNLFEKFKMEYRIREALFDGAQMGDYCAHFYWNPDAVPYGGAFGPYKGEIEMELVDGINVMFGNPNTPDVESQPYILLLGRDTVEFLKEEAELFAKSRTKRGGVAETDIVIDSLNADSEWQWQAGIGGRTELTPSDDRTGKALYGILYTKVTKEEPVINPDTGEQEQVPVQDDKGNPVQQTTPDGVPMVDSNGDPIYKMRGATRLKTSVHVTKATKTMIIYEDVDTGLSRYPVAWGNWEKQKNQYHGRALVTGIVPNQIFINSMMAMIFRHLQLQSFPKTIYNADLIGQWNNEVGAAIGVHNLQPGMSLRDVATSLQPADMSNQIVMCIDRVMQYTRDCLGATDAQMGNVRPDNTSALMVLQSSAEVPLENTRSGLHEWVEDIGAILLDMMGTYYGKRPIVRERTFEDVAMGKGQTPMIDPTTGQMMTQTTTHRVLEDFDFNQLKKLWFNIRVDVGATTYYSEIAMVQTLDNLRRDGTLEIIDYLERIPDKLIPRKQDLIEDIKKRTAEVAQQTAAMQQATLEQQGGMMPGQQGPQISKTPRSDLQNAGFPSMGGDISAEKAISNLPGSIQAKYNDLPRSAQKALVQKGSM